MEFQFDFILSTLLTGFNILFYVFLWKSVYGGHVDFQGISREQMIVYSIASNIMIEVFVIEVDGNINRSVRDGSISYLMSRPMNLINFWLSGDMGNLIGKLVTNAIPIVGLCIYISYVNVAVSLFTLLTFILSAIASYLILWNISLITGSVAFWFNELGTISQLKELVILLLSGSFVPLWFFPSWAQAISNFLPFQYIYQMPLGMLIGKYKGVESLKKLLFQILWVIVFAIIAHLVYQKANKKVIVQGG